MTTPTIPVVDPRYPNHPMRFDPTTNAVESWQSHADEWRIAVRLTTESITRMAAATQEATR